MNWKRGKRLAILGLALAMSCSLCACQKSEQTETAEEEVKLPELKIGVDILKPFFYKDENGDYAGIDAELAREACSRAGYEPVFTEVQWDERDEYLENGTVDCVWTAFIQDGREDEYCWTESYLESELKVLVDAACPDKTVKDLRSRGGIAVRGGSKAEEILLEDNAQTLTKTSQVYSCGTFKLAEIAFIKGYAGALAGQEEVLKQIVSEYPGTYRLFDDSLMKIHLGVAFYKENDGEQFEAINNAIKDMKQDGTISAIYEKYDQNLSEEEVTSDDQN